MKECEKYAALLDAFSEGDLFMEDMVQVQNHLLNCPDCQAYLEDLMVMRAEFPTIEDTEVPEGFADRVMAAVAQAPQATVPAPKAKKPVWRKVLVPLAACCAVVILLGRTAISGGSNSSKSAMSTVSYSAATESAVMTEETVAETTEETTEAAPQEPQAYTMTTATGAAPEAEAYNEEDYEYALEDLKEEAKAKEPAEDGANAPMGALTADTTGALVLTAEEAGDLLDGFTPTMETESEVHYELTAHEYTGLLLALPRDTRQSAPANAAETMIVIVGK